HRAAGSLRHALPGLWRHPRGYRRGGRRQISPYYDPMIAKLIVHAATREGAAAVRAAKAVDYQGAGTIEFIADASDGLKADRIWFMEMNTRLQVEHPVTESITGVDLVEWQLRVAAGQPVPLAQADIPMKGWAMEARLYAEDPANGFLPSIGRLDHFVMPDDIRVDTGVMQGGEVSQFYDPMIAKLIVHEDTREAAAARLADACREVEVWPVKTNAGFMARCLDHPRFVKGDVDTGFIAAEEGALIAPAQVSARALAAAAGQIGLEADAAAFDAPDNVLAPAPGSGVRRRRRGRVPTPQVQRTGGRLRLRRRLARAYAGQDRRCARQGRGQGGQGSAGRGAGGHEDGARPDRALRRRGGRVQCRRRRSGHGRCGAGRCES
uniref:3-methylcrotonyl-CoA carboxylase n=1 Tax=Parastrongyloides trichosuri TaxID=131310 RepID=A0A0N4Z8Z6_PARTI